MKSPLIVAVLLSVAGTWGCQKASHKDIPVPPHHFYFSVGDTVLWQDSTQYDWTKNVNVGVVEEVSPESSCVKLIFLGEDFGRWIALDQSGLYIRDVIRKGDVRPDPLEGTKENKK